MLKIINRQTLVVLVLIIGITLGVAVASARAENLSAGIVLADDQGKVLYHQNSEQQFVPASILKILTSLAALHLLGEDHRFQTVYFFDEPSKNLYIKGFGDPLFFSEVIDHLCRDICLKTSLVHDIILDQSYFSGQIQIPGQGGSLNPYDAPVGALCANFNTITFKWSTAQKKFISAEPQTPLLPVFLDDIRASRLEQGRIVLTRQQSSLYAGQLIKHGLEKNHTRVLGPVRQGVLEGKKGKTTSFLSPFDLKEVVKKLLTYSNNYMANQLLLSMGATEYGPPATLEKGLKAVQAFSRQYLKFNTLILAEGSGLSRTNLISPDQMIQVLVKFMPYHSLLKVQGNDFFKTGTLSDVRTRAGYLKGRDKRLYPYVIMVSGPNRGVAAIQRHLVELVFKRTRQ